jgi:sigma-B regulation protein RsbU (phosphoserine phosphatase)
MVLSVAPSHDAGAALHAGRLTDGVPEATNLEVEDFSDARLLHALREAAGLPSREMIDRVSSRLIAFTVGAPQSDDITMVAIRR